MPTRNKLNSLFDIIYNLPQPPFPALFPNIPKFMLYIPAKQAWSIYIQFPPFPSLSWVILFLPDETVLHCLEPS